MRYIEIMLVVLLCGCGGGGGSGGGAAGGLAPAGGVTETFVAKYTVRRGDLVGCQLGILYNDGLVPFSLGSPCIERTTVVTIDGRPFDPALVSEGSVAVVRASRTSFPGGRETSAMTSMDIERTVVGTIESVDSLHARVSILGQRIDLYDTTKISLGSGTIDALAPGDRVSVSGFFSSDGEVVATAISSDAGTTGFVLRGILNAHVGGGFQIGRMTLDLANAAFEGFPGGAPADGDPVLVFAAAAPVSDVLTPDSVQFLGGELGEGPEAIRIFVGLVSKRTAPSEMEVEGRSVDCAFFQCQDATQVQPGTLVDLAEHALEGSAAGGVGVEVLDPATDSVRVIGHVGAVDPQNGSLTVVGFRVQVLPATITTDETSQPKSIGDVAVGDNISVEGGPVGDVIVAGRVDTYTNGSGPSITQVMTRVASYANPDIQVMGRTISTNATTTVSEDCVGEKDRPWLFDTAAQGSINQLRMEVFGPVNGELVATHIDVDDGACYPWDY